MTQVNQTNQQKHISKLVILRSVTAVLVIASLAFGWAAYRTAAAASSAAHELLARGNTLKAVQAIETELIRVDTASSNILLAGVLNTEPYEKAYQEIRDSVIERLVLALNRANPDEQKMIKTILSGLDQHSALVGNAKANSRQGFPLGAAYMRTASTLMHDTLIPTAEELIKSSTQSFNAQVRSETQHEKRAAIRDGGSPIAGIMLLLLLIGTQVYLAVKRNPIINIPLAIATIMTVSTFVWLAATVESHGNTIGIAKKIEVDVSFRMRQIRTLVADTHSALNLALLERGNGAPYFSAFVDKSDRIITLASPPAPQPGEKAEPAIATLLKNRSAVMAGGIALKGTIADINAIRSTGAPLPFTKEAITRLVEKHLDYLELFLRIKQEEDSGAHGMAVELAISQGGQLVNSIEVLNRNIEGILRQSDQSFANTIQSSESSLRRTSLYGLGFGAALTILVFLGMRPRIEDYRA